MSYRPHSLGALEYFTLYTRARQQYLADLTDSFSLFRWVRCNTSGSSQLLIYLFRPCFDLLHVLYTREGLVELLPQTHIFQTHFPRGVSCIFPTPIGTVQSILAVHPALMLALFPELVYPPNLGFPEEEGLAIAKLATIF